MRPRELRIRLYDEVLRLRRRGLSYRQIIDRIQSVHGVRLSKSHVSEWIRGIHSPYNGIYIPSIDYLKPSKELSYIIGVVAGDGYSKQRAKKYKGYNDVRIGLTVKDREFAEEFAGCLSKVLGRKPLKPSYSKHRGWFVVEVESKTLYQLLRKPLEMDRLRPFIEHCRGCMAAFLRGFSDSEGSVTTDGRICIINTDKSLLNYVRELLYRLGIETAEPRLHIKAGTPLKDPRTHKKYRTNKDAYRIYVPADSRLRFYQLIGLTIERKKKRLENYLIKHGLLKKAPSQTTPPFSPSLNQLPDIEHNGVYCRGRDLNPIGRFHRLSTTRL
ncbi:hypothetical protein HRbin01_01424 [archaeon HR01]|nr:hypothetical protein HRbin01_01424 [archaeon HR01]